MLHFYKSILKPFFMRKHIHACADTHTSYIHGPAILMVDTHCPNQMTLWKYFVKISRLI